MAPMDVRISCAVSVPILAMSYAEAFLSGKLTTPAAAGIYFVILHGILLIILKNQAFNERLARAGWQVEEEMRKEKEMMGIILLDLLPREYAQSKVENNNKIRGTKHKAVILFSDLQGFSRLAEKMSPQDVGPPAPGCEKIEAKTSSLRRCLG